MKNTAKKLASIALVCLTVLTLTLNAFAEKVVYSDTHNTGKRDEICLSLEGTGAESY